MVAWEIDRERVVTEFNREMAFNEHLFGGWGDMPCRGLYMYVKKFAVPWLASRYCPPSLLVVPYLQYTISPVGTRPPGSRYIFAYYSFHDIRINIYTIYQYTYKKNRLSKIYPCRGCWCWGHFQWFRPPLFLSGWLRSRSWRWTPALVFSVNRILRQEGASEVKK